MITKDSDSCRDREKHTNTGWRRIQTPVSRGDQIFQDSLCSISRLQPLHSRFLPLHRASGLLLKSAFGQCLRPQFRDGDVRKVPVRLLVTGAG